MGHKEPCAGDLGLLSPSSGGHSDIPDPPPKAPSQKEMMKCRYCNRQCGKSFLRLCHLGRSTALSMLATGPSCAQCGKHCGSEESFKAHVLARQGVQPFQCTQCDKACCTKPVGIIQEGMGFRALAEGVEVKPGI